MSTCEPAQKVWHAYVPCHHFMKITNCVIGNLKPKQNSGLQLEKIFVEEGQRNCTVAPARASPALPTCGNLRLTQ
jgi:hypothetical protein